MNLYVHENWILYIQSNLNQDDDTGPQKNSLYGKSIASTTPTLEFCDIYQA